MKTLYRSLLLTLGALALAGTAFAQVPSTNDTSDNADNTGMGSGALGGPAATNGGAFNTASGRDALLSNTSGSNNTASGAAALASNTTGSDNTASGFQALLSNKTGSYNTAAGTYALENNNASQNSAMGYAALLKNTTATQNAAFGYQALTNNNGGNNSAFGWEALTGNTTGIQNTSFGSSAMAFNTSGNSDVAVGYGSLYHNNGDNNAASGWQSLNANTTGADNTAAGSSALFSNTTGSGNIALGFQAGFNLTTGSNNIDIGNVGVAGESNLIRIGTKGTHKGAVIAGISTFAVTGAAVYVTGTGRLGVLASSQRYKTAIAPIGDSTEKLRQLRPVSFHLKSDPKGAIQYGLIAEEVAKVYPELVIRNERGRIDGVRYDELAPMLLNEVLSGGLRRFAILSSSSSSW